MDMLKDILGKLLKATPNYAENQLKSRVFEAWPQIVGERVAKHAWPVKLLDDQYLLVATESSAWMHNLRFLEAQIVEKYEKALGKKEVRGVRFKLGTAPLQK